MSTFFLHVGMMKTATTALQRWLAANRDRLRREGLAVPRLPHANHSHFFIARYKPALRLDGGQRQRERLALYPDDAAVLDARFDAFLARAAADGLDVLMSAEMIAGLPVEGLERLAETVSARMDRIVTIALVRPPRAFARSQGQELVRQGHPVADLAARPPRANYAGRIGRPAKALGADEVRLAVFHPSRLVDGCALRTLLALAGRDVRFLGDERLPRVNESMSLASAKLVSLLAESRRAGAFSPAIPEPVRRRLSRGSAGAFYRRAFRAAPAGPSEPPALASRLLGVPGPRFALPREVAEAAAAGPDARWLAARLGDDLAALDEPADADLPALSDFARLSAAETAAIVAHLDRGAAPSLPDLSALGAAFGARGRRDRHDLFG